MPNTQSAGGSFLPLAGGTLTGNLNLGLNSLILNAGGKGGVIKGDAANANRVLIRNIADNDMGEVTLYNLNAANNIVMLAGKTVDGVDVSEITSMLYVDRGDPADYDWDKFNFTQDGSYYDLDLSSIVPANAKLVHLRVALKSPVGNSVFSIRKKGNSNTFNNFKSSAPDNSQQGTEDGFVVPDANREIQYMASNVAWTTLYMLVAGWYI